MLPAELAAAIASRAQGRPRADLRERAARISENFRERRTTRDAVRDDADALAYALTRMPATYAAAFDVLSRAQQETGLAPLRLLDVGCGLAAASFAAAEVFPSLRAITLVDRSPAFLALARELTRESASAALADATIVAADVTRAPLTAGAYDLAIVSYALTELADGDIFGLLDRLMASAAQIVVIEPGTPRDFARLRRARAHLISAGAAIALPCPTTADCPIIEPDWCHFATRLARSKDHRMLKDAGASYEDEKYCYLVTGAQSGLRSAGRVLRRPMRRKFGVELQICASDGLRAATVKKSDRDDYDRCRRIGWGDSVDLSRKDGS